MQRSSRSYRIVLGLIVSVASVLSAGLVGPAAAYAAGTPSGPKYVYEMLNVYKSSSRVKSEAITDINCNRTPNNGSASYSTSYTSSNSFTYTGGASFSELAGALSQQLSISGGVTTSTTSTYTVGISLKPGQCTRVYELRDKYYYELYRKCRYACADTDYHYQGDGYYSKAVGRAFYLV